ncbi:hypothetical protein [Terricaulis sp.]|uniref:hypothetical protein n=1 Tax=Terricaulis sp. TaxID=2768686 RepID=UPI003783C123
MGEPLSYARGWFRTEKMVIDPLTPEAARALHDAGALYTVIVGPAEKPRAFLEVSGETGYVGVNFLDAELRAYLTYDFQRRGDEPLFLSGGSYAEFVGRTDDVALWEQYRFFKEGRVHVSRSRKADETEEVGERSIDVSANYEAWPDFGDYRRLLIIERDIISRA